MPNRRLTPAELEDARLLLTMVRAGLRQLAGDDAELLFALRRKVYKELVYDERDKPMVRRRLKSQKRQQQGGLCAICSQPLPEKYCVLDRLEGAAGYTAENTRLVCPGCDVTTQQSRGYA
jgi:hypothetical protein